MIIGPIVIRWKKDVIKEHDKRTKAKAVSAKVMEITLAQSIAYRDRIRRWGLSEGVEPPNGARASI